MAPSRGLLFGAVVLAAAASAVFVLREVLFPVFVGFGLAYACGPIADALERRGWRRESAALGVLGAIALAGTLAIALILPALVEEAAVFAAQLPDHIGTALDRGHSLAARYGINVPNQKDEILMRLRETLSGISLSSLSPLGRFAQKFFSGAAGLLVGALNLVVVPLVFFYLLRDLPELRRAVVGLAPHDVKPSLEHRLDEADQVFSGYLRGQLSVALILACIYSLGLSLAGVRFGVVIGVLSGLMNIIPYLGVFTGLALSLVMALVEFSGWGQLVGVGVVFSVAQVLEGFWITPKVVGDRVGLTPLETIIALILGGEWGGLAGLILAIPVAGCLKVYAKDAFEAYRRSSWYGQPPEEIPA